MSGRYSFIPDHLISERRFPSARWKPSTVNPTTLELEPVNSDVPWLTVDPATITSNSPTLTRHCKPLVVTLAPGQVLYLPTLWFHSVFQLPNPHGLCVAINFWYDMDFTTPIYPLYNYLRHTTMIAQSRSQEIPIVE